MLSAATSTINVRIRNITLRSTCSAVKKVWLRRRQSTLKTGRPAASVISLEYRGHVLVAIEIELRLAERHVHDAGVVLRHADLEGAGDLVGLDARHGAHRGDGAARRHQGDGVAGVQRQELGEPLADHHRLPLVEAVERAAGDVAGDRAEPRQIGGAHAAHLHPGRVERRGGERLSLDHRGGEDHARDPGDPLGDLLVVGQRGIERLDQDMAVEAEDLVEQLRAEAVHHRHHGDQGGDAQHDAEEREQGDHRNESLPPARPEVAQRQHPFEGSERPRGGRLGHCL
jgi:hypothetical protein